MAASTRYHARRETPGGICYRVLMWEADALPPTRLESWKQQRHELLLAMRDAGIKGSRGRLAELTAQLKTLTEEQIETPLATRERDLCFSYARGEGARGEIRHTEQAAPAATPAPAAKAAPMKGVPAGEKLITALDTDAAVLAYRLTPCSITALVELQGEEGVDTCISRWRHTEPEHHWCSEPVIEAISPAEALAWQETCRRNARQQQEQQPSTDTSDTESSTAPFHHITVLAEQAAALLQPAEGRIIVDATLGGGGHSELMLKAGATVWGIDQDPAARRAARHRLAAYGNRLHILAGNFRNTAELLHEQGITAIDGLLADIGISSPQVDNAERGFSFLAEGPLDMRMNPDAPLSAADIVNHASETELADILWQYGEERASRAIARRIIQQRGQAPITTTTQLAELIASILPRKGKQHPATRSFQALRIAVNDELGALDALLTSGLKLLKSGGRFAIITFHSLEDRAVKRFFERVTKPEIDRPEWPAPRPNPEYAARLLFKRPIIATDDELRRNPRARSAKLRAIEKL